MFHIRAYQDSDKSDVIKLWHQVGLAMPQNNAEKDIERKLQVNPELFLVAIMDDLVIASVMGGYDGHRGWINYLGVSLDHQRQGVASAMMSEIQGKLNGIGCAKINLQVRKTNTEAIKFYQSIGYLDDNVVGLGKRLEEDI
jgi:ribosomal protein S18 acetylase RimI-like enzyme